MVAPIAVKCEISRGAFSGERIVTIKCSDGTVRKALAPLIYCWNDQKLPIGEDAPEGDSIPGYVAARRLSHSTSNVSTIELPDGEVMVVSGDLIEKRPVEAESHVSV